MALPQGWEEGTGGSILPAAGQGQGESLLRGWTSQMSKRDGLVSGLGRDLGVRGCPLAQLINSRAAQDATAGQLSSVQAEGIFSPGSNKVPKQKPLHLPLTVLGFPLPGRSGRPCSLRQG